MKGCYSNRTSCTLPVIKDWQKQFTFMPTCVLYTLILSLHWQMYLWYYMTYSVFCVDTAYSHHPKKIYMYVLYVHIHSLLLNSLISTSNQSDLSFLDVGAHNNICWFWSFCIKGKGHRGHFTCLYMYMVCWLLPMHAQTFVTKSSSINSNARAKTYHKFHCIFYITNNKQ